MMKGGNNSSRTKYNQRNNRQNGGGANDYRNRLQQQQQQQQKKPQQQGQQFQRPDGAGYQRQSRFSNALPSAPYQNGADGSKPASYNQTSDKRPLAYQTQSPRYDSANGYAQKAAGYGQTGVPKPAYQQYHSLPISHVYSAPPPVVQYAYPPPVLPVKN